MVKISTNLLVTLFVSASALAIPTHSYHRREASERKVYQRASDTEGKTLASRGPHVEAILKKAKFGNDQHDYKHASDAEMKTLLSWGPITAAVEKAKQAGLTLQHQDQHKRDLDKDSFAARETHDEDNYIREFAEDFTAREVEDLAKREPLF